METLTPEDNELQQELQKLQQRQAEILELQSRPLPTPEQLKANRANQELKDKVCLTTELLKQAQQELDNAKEVMKQAEIKVKITMDILKKLK